MKTKSRSRELTFEEAESFGRELDALKREVQGDLGQRDVDHIRAIMRLVRYSEGAGRALLHFGVDPVTFVLGASALSLSKILENMEVGHNVMHGQYDWTKDPALDSRAYEWDAVCAGDDWRHSHNYEHHTFTNVIGRDRDVGYAFLRVTGDQEWNWTHTVQPVSALVLASMFQWGIAAHEARLPETLAGVQPVSVFRERARPFFAKARWQLGKDYVFYPALALGNFPRVVAGNLLANLGRNLWSFAIIFCGHFPEDVRFYREEEAETEGRGQWYLRQLNGSSNIEGGKWLHVMSGHLSHQIEHHLFPDLPAARYPEIAPRVREICERYGQMYNTGSFGKQLRSVARTLIEHAVPPRSSAPSGAFAQRAA
jgi:linoleoyl-CoA desaturase